MCDTTVTKAALLAAVTGIVRETEALPATETRWGVPLLGIADSRDPGFAQLKTLIDPMHALPSDVLPDARAVVSYYIPFLPDTAAANRGGTVASPGWARAYEETNAMFAAINRTLLALLSAAGYTGAVPAQAQVFNREKIVSYWSQRHIARLAGLGTFGRNNMLITTAGCCGRFNSIVTNAPLPADSIVSGERCLNKSSGKCGACFRACPSGALTPDGFDRHKCLAACKENAKLYRAFGASYGDAKTGSEVCGKCVCGMPCAFRIPG